MDLVNIVEIIVSVLMLILAFLAINSKSLVKSVMFLSALSMLAVVGFVLMKAPDVAVTEAVIGSGLVTSLFIFTLLAARKVGNK
ncbi:MAG: hypothetical protein KQ78_00411 [Candidatus Izimaplasma bacterium HR2]|nr:MAG: hypothetical protein KQ78_00411 [Candidatus Izimaplasma bacterium HR2]